MYHIFKCCAADTQGGGVDTYYPVITIDDYNEALSNLMALKEQSKDDSWTHYILFADKAEIDELNSQIESLENHIEDLNDYE